MMKQLLLNSFTAPLLIRPVLYIHNLAYKLAGRLGVILNNGEHPKTDIIRYIDWFSTQVNADDIVIDVGSHKGKMARALASKANSVYGVELLTALHEKALLEKNPENLKFICDDATKMDYSQLPPINKVTLSNVLEHIDKRVEFLNKLCSQVNWQGGKACLLIRVPLIERDWISVYKKKLGVDFRLDPTHYTEYTLEQFQDELQQAGLKIESHSIKYGELFAKCIYK